MAEVKSLTYVEIDVPYCSLIWTQSPCLAVPYTGVAPCFNTIKTCQSRTTFTNSPATLRFAMDTAYLPQGIEAIPSLVDATLSPGTVSLGEDLGVRSTLALKFKDHPHSDTGTGFDKYLSQRSYNPFAQGTFWGKFRARQPYVFGIPIRLIRGTLGQTLAQMETRHYIGDNFDGPGADGYYTLNAKDALRFATGDVAQAPVVSNGYCSNSLDTVQTSLTLLPAGIGDAEYATSGYVCISGNEVCSFTRAADVLTLTRAQLGTTANTHSANDAVQTVLRYAALSPATIIQDLLQTYAKVPSSYIPISAWQTEVATYLGQVYTATITAPTNVDQLISELIKQAALALWWDDSSQQIKLQVIRGVAAGALTFDESKIIAGTLKVEEQPDKRMTECWINYGQRDPTLPLTQLNNFTSVSATVNAQMEADYGTAVIDSIDSRWIAQGGRTIAQALASVRLNRYLNPPRKFSFDIMRYTDSVVLGGGYQIAFWNLQDSSGARVNVPIQVTRLDPKADRLSIEAQEATLSGSTISVDPNTHTITIDVDQQNLNLKTLHDALYAPATSGQNVVCIINAGVRVGSVTTSVPAFDIGTGWASGVNISLINNGKIQGAGGNAGKGAAKNPPPNGTDGNNGGTALYSRSNFSLTNDGSIWSGGGGGGGGGGNSSGAGGGGGGGAGWSVAGNGASAGGGGGGNNGHDGTEFSGGSGGSSVAGDGGHGGGPGSDGNSGGAGGGKGNGGNQGASIDGVSFCTIVNAGDILGFTFN